MTPEQNKRLGQLLLAGVPLPIALPIALDPDPMGSITAGVNQFNQGANTVLDAVASPVKAKRKASAYSRRYKAAFKKLAPKYKNKNGTWKKGGFRSAVRAAHKEAKK